MSSLYPLKKHGSKKKKVLLKKTLIQIPAFKIGSWGGSCKIELFKSMSFLYTFHFHFAQISRSSKSKLRNISNGLVCCILQE